jgi:hypothetical protein
MTIHTHNSHKEMSPYVIHALAWQSRKRKNQVCANASWDRPKRLHSGSSLSTGCVRFPKKNLLLENDSEIKKLLETLHRADKFAGKFDPQFHASYLRPTDDPYSKHDKVVLSSREGVLLKD